MDIQFPKTVTHYQNRRRWNRNGKRITTVLASVVVFITTYALILPAITMEPAYICGKEAHVHSEACYQLPEAVPLASLICSADTLGIHSHTTECYDENGEPRCGIAEFVLHTHNSDCCNADGELVCTLPEVKEHVHSESCWQQPHVHEDVCYIQQRGEIVCTQEEGSVHTHQDACYTQQDNLICTLHETAPHTHTTEACYTETKDLLCTEPEVEAHTHSDSCYTAQTTQICSQEEVDGHTHGDGCFAEDGSMICALPEIVGHTHTDACFQTTSNFICTLVETAGHTHGDACYSAPVSSLTCTTEETAGHTHGIDCFETVDVVTCTIEEGVPHAHTDACFVCTPVLQCVEQTAEDGAVPVLTCEEEELFLHIHEESCFNESGICTCGMLQVAEHIHDDTCFVITQEQPTDPVLVCGCEEHEHSEICIAQKETDNTLTTDQLIAEGYYCGVAEHIHADENNCFAEDSTIMCTMTQHEHDWICELIPVDLSDVETAEDWEADLPELQGNIAADLIAVAQSQLGYEQSEVNYIIENDEQLFYSRYADWWSYGEEPYGDWNAQFVSFCLKYAETGLKLYDDPAMWANELFFTDLWLDAGSTPVESDLVFFDNNGDGAADRVGIITAVYGKTFTVILERRGLVQQVTYDLDDSDILGYGMVTGELSDPTVDHMVETVNAMIDALPTSEEADAVLMAYEDAGDMEGYEAYFRELAEMTECAYAIYEVMTEEQIAAVVDVKKLLDLGWTWQMQLFSITDSVPVYGVNAYATKMIVRPGTSADSVDSGTGFAWWTAVVVEEDSKGKLYVAQIYADHSNSATKNHLSATTANGFVLFTHDYTPNASRGDLVTVSFDYKIPMEPIPLALA